MDPYYELAKRIALGLEKDLEIQTGDDIWGISLGDSFSIQTEMPYQFFEKGFAPPDELTAQRAALMLYDEEFAADQKQAEENLAALKEALRGNDLAALKELFAKAGTEEWMSLVFLDGEKLQNELAPLLDQADLACQKVAADAFEKGLKKLVDFQDLLEALIKHCS